MISTRFSHRRLRVFLSAPYTSDPEANVRRVLDCADELITDGYLPLVPHFWHFLDLLHPRAYSEWMALDDELLLLADVVVRLPGLSAGADAEEERANDLRIPVLHADPSKPLADQLRAVLA